MNNNIRNLYSMAMKPERLIIGLMSGTSVDGLDVAVCKFSGSGQHTKLDLLQFETVPFNEDYKNEVQSIFSKKLVSLEKLCLLNAWVADQHAQIILKCLANHINIMDQCFYKMYCNPFEDGSSFGLKNNRLL